MINVVNSYIYPLVTNAGVLRLIQNFDVREKNAEYYLQYLLSSYFQTSDPGVTESSTFSSDQPITDTLLVNNGHARIDEFDDLSPASNMS